MVIKEIIILRVTKIELKMDKVVERFIEYVKVNTQSDEDSGLTPSTPGQMEFQNILAEELKKIGLEEIDLDENGYLMATLPANTKEEKPVIGFVAHVDTSPEYTGANVKPQITQRFVGKPIIINEKKNILLSPRDFPVLNKYVGQAIISSDGTTLLGADNKAGIAEIITAMEELKNDDTIKHGKIRIAFTPDEEIGKGADHFNVEKFGADFAYTIDGGELGELEFENFNAASARITIQGLNVHPGTAKNKMKNSMTIAMELNNMLPANEKPEFTDGYEGFFHLIQFKGDVEHTELRYIIRDHNKELFIRKKELILKVVDHINLKYGSGTAKLVMFDQYYNMREKIEPVFHIVELAQKAMNESGVFPKILPIRGGTDGSRLSFMNLPCPNIFTGGHNFHSRYEFIPIPSMLKAVKVIKKIAELA